MTKTLASSRESVEQIRAEGYEAMHGESIFDLIRAFADAKAIAQPAEAAEAALYNLPGRPDWPCVKAREFPLICNMLERGDYLTPSQIDAAVDRRQQIVSRPAWKQLGHPETAERRAGILKALDAGEEMRKRMHALYTERKAAYEDWKERSGWGAASEESERLWNIAFELHDRVLAFPCTTMSEIAAKAQFILDEHGEEYAPEKQHEFIQEVARLAVASEASS